MDGAHSFKKYSQFGYYHCQRVCIYVIVDYQTGQILQFKRFRLLFGKCPL